MFGGNTSSLIGIHPSVEAPWFRGLTLSSQPGWSIRLPSRNGAEPGTEAPHLEGEHDGDDAADDHVDTEDQLQRGKSRLDVAEDDNAKHDREDSEGDEQPLRADGFAKPPPPEHQQETHDDRPRGDQIGDDLGGKPGIEPDDEPQNDAQRADQQRRPAALVTVLLAKGGEELARAVDGDVS